LFNVTVMFGPRATPLTLTYRNLLDAQRVSDRFEDAVRDEDKLFEVEDDFGQRARLTFPFIACVVEDLDAGVEAAVERAIVQTRAQAKAQIAVRSDPTIRAASIGSGLMPGNGQRL